MSRMRRTGRFLHLCHLTVKEETLLLVVTKVLSLEPILLMLLLQVKDLSETVKSCMKYMLVILPLLFWFRWTNSSSHVGFIAKLSYRRSCQLLFLYSPRPNKRQWKNIWDLWSSKHCMVTISCTSNGENAKLARMSYGPCSNTSSSHQTSNDLLSIHLIDCRHEWDNWWPRCNMVEEISE